MVDSGAPGGAIEGGAVWSVAGGCGRVVVDQGGGEGGGVVVFFPQLNVVGQINSAHECLRPSLLDFLFSDPPLLAAIVIVVVIIV